MPSQNSMQNFLVQDGLFCEYSFVFQISGLPIGFQTEVHAFVRELFLSGQTELQDLSVESATRGPCRFNSRELALRANATCVDLLVWAANDETGSDLNTHCSVMNLQHGGGCLKPTYTVLEEKLNWNESCSIQSWTVYLYQKLHIHFWNGLGIIVH